MKATTVSIFAICILASFVIASQQNVTFIGNFSNGTVLYSDTNYFSQVNITGKDAYPIRQNCTTNTSCAVYNYTTTKTCLNVSQKTGRCLKFQINKTITGCKRNVTIIRCAPFAAFCQNPSGNPTNQLSLTNFFYSINNTANVSEWSWSVVPYIKLSLNSTNLTFRVIIPANCTPNYSIDEAIKLEY